MNKARLAFDGRTSATVARRVRAQFRRCWHNAALAVSLLGPGAFYVEGWIVTSHADPFVIEHGWCEGAGRLVDPSYAPAVSPFDPPVAYFTGMRFSIKEAEAAVYRRKLPLAWSDEHREHREAFDAAWRYATRYRRLGSLPPTRVVHCRREPSDLIIARPSKWAGPFYFGRDGTREEVIAKFRRWLIRQPRLLHDVWTLRGKALGCHCPPLPCHGDVLAELANVCDGGTIQPRPEHRSGKDAELHRHQHVSQRGGFL